MVEFALVLPVLMVLLLGMVSGASAWNQSQALGQGSRVGARFASTLPLPADAAGMDAWLDGIIDRTVAASEGEMAAGVLGRAICVAYVYPTGTVAPDRTASRRMDASGTRTSATSTCFSDGQGASARRIQVLVERTGMIDIGFHRQQIALRRQVVYRYEAHGGL